MTRTFAIGYAPPGLRQIYDDVLATFEGVVAALQPGERTRRYQELACELFKERDHVTIGPRTMTSARHSSPGWSLPWSLAFTTRARASACASKTPTSATSTAASAA
jgi:hypothetical protein